MSDQPFAAMIVPMGAAGPVDPGFGNRPGHPPVDPGFGHGNPAHPWLPGHGGGANSGHIDNTLPVPPAPPSTKPPIQIWPPTAPIFPAGPDNELPPAGSIWPPLPPGMPAGELLVLVYITGIGWRWTVIDTGLTVDNTLPPSPEPK